MTTSPEKSGSVRRPRRFSPAAPYMLSQRQQIALLDGLAADQELREDIETVLGVEDLLKKPKQEQLAILRRYIDGGFGAALLAQVAQARQNLHRAAQRERGELEKDDRIALLETEIQAQKERMDAQRQEFEAAMADMRARFIETHPPTTGTTTTTPTEA